MAIVVTKWCQKCRRQAEETHFCGVCHKCKRECEGVCKKYNGARMQVAGKTYRENRLTRALGVEIEAGEWGRAADTLLGLGYGCQMVRDGSVEPSGREIVVPPMQGDEVVKRLGKIAEVMVQGGVRMNRTCGYHVHVDGEDLGWWDVVRVLEGYLRCETEIYALCAPGRAQGQYCKPLGDVGWECVGRARTAKSTDEVKVCVVEWLYGQDLPIARDEAEVYKARVGNKVVDGYHRGRSYVRYVGLNMHSWMHRGTLEWRMKEGTIDEAAVVMWPLFCGWFVEVCGGMGDKAIATVRELGDVVRDMPTGVREWVKDERERIKRMAEGRS